jgi:hypothetical protein
MFARDDRPVVGFVRNMMMMMMNSYTDAGVAHAELP